MDKKETKIIKTYLKELGLRPTKKNIDIFKNTYAYNFYKLSKSLQNLSKEIWKVLKRFFKNVK